MRVDDEEVGVLESGREEQSRVRVGGGEGRTEQRRVGRWGKKCQPTLEFRVVQGE
jgi:hypothetical protein